MKIQHPTKQHLQIWLLQEQEVLRRYWQLCLPCKATQNALRNRERTSTSSSSRSPYVESEQPRSVHSTSHIDNTVVGSLVNYTLNSIFFGSHGRSKAVCCHHLERKGRKLTKEFAGARLTIHTDHIRPRSASPTVPSSFARLGAQPPDYLSRWTKTHPNAAMCVSSQSSHTDDRMEGCPSTCRVNVGEQWWRLCSRIPQSASRRSHRGSKNQLDSMCGRDITSLQPKTVGSACENYQYLTNHIALRKRTSRVERRNYWKTMQLRSSGF